jgi:hypothetical protein
MSRFKVLGVNDDQNFCECCGKTGLKRVVWVEDTETGDIKHFGTTCAIKPAKGFDCEKEIKKAINAFNGKESAIMRIALSKYRKAGYPFIGNIVDGLSPMDKEIFNQFLVEVRNK